MILNETINDAPLHKGGGPNCKSTCHVAIADSVGELADAISNTPDRLRVIDSHSGKTEWFGRSGVLKLSDAVEMATAPWEDGVEVVESMLAELRDAELPTLTTRRRRRRWADDDGDDVCNDRLRSGQAYWRSSHRPPSKIGGMITIVSDMRAACCVDAKNILWRGAASIALTYLLERAGYRVELWTAQAAGANFKNGDDMLVAARVKGHGQPLDIGSAVSAVSAWFYRSLGFSAANLFKPQPDPCCGYDRAGGLRLFADRYFARPNEACFFVEAVFSRKAALDLIRSASQAVTSGDLSACPWCYSCDTHGDPKLITK